MLPPGRRAHRAPALPSGATVPAPPPAARTGHNAGRPRGHPVVSRTVTPEQAAETRRDSFSAFPGRKWLKRGAFGMHSVIYARCKQATHGQNQRLSAPSCSPSLCSLAVRFRPGSAPDDRINPGLFTGLKILLHRTLSTRMEKGAAVIQSIGD